MTSSNSSFYEETNPSPVAVANLQALVNTSTTNANAAAASAAAALVSQNAAAATLAASLTKANNLSDVANAATSRTNLGLGTAAVQNVAAFAQTANNLSDVASAPTARTNLGLGSASTLAIAAVLQSANNLSDLASAPAALGNLGLDIPWEPGGRLTLTSGTPVMPNAVSAATTVYFTPYNGSTLPVWNSTLGKFVPRQFSELSNILANSSVGNAGPSATASQQVYDFYVWDTTGNNGPLALTRSPAWSAGTGGSNTARGTGAGGSAQTRVQGIMTNTVSITNGPAASLGTYVGTIATDSGTGNVSWSRGGAASGGTPATLNVWSMYNRVLVPAFVMDNGAGYTYTSATIRQARASGGNQISVVIGQQDDGIQVSYAGRSQTVAAASALVYFGVGLDSTTSFAFQPNMVFASSAAVYVAAGTSASTLFPGIGVHVISANEASDGTNANVFVGQALNTLSAIVRM